MDAGRPRPACVRSFHWPISGRDRRKAS